MSSSRHPIRSSHSLNTNDSRYRSMKGDGFCDSLEVYEQ
jgi:hypothetical protein